MVRLGLLKNVMKTLSKNNQISIFFLSVSERERERVTEMERGKKKGWLLFFSFFVLIRPTFTPENNKQINKIINTIEYLNN